MKHCFMFFVLIAVAAVNAGWLGDIANFVAPEKRVMKTVTRPPVCEALKPANKPVQPQQSLPGSEMTIGSDLSLAEILKACGHECVTQVVLARFNGFKSTVANVPANTTVRIPTCEQADSIRAVMAQERAQRKAERAAVANQTRTNLPTMADDGYFHWRKANADPYDSAGVIPFEETLNRLGLPEDVKPLFGMAYTMGDYESDYIGHGTVWVEMLSGGGKVCKGPKGLKAEIGSATTKYAALIYRVEYDGYIYELANPSVCHNWMWRVYKPYEPPPPVIDSLPSPPPPVVDTTPWFDTVPEEVVIPPPEPTKSCRRKIQSNLWQGLTTPLNNGVEGMQYFNSYLGADFHYYFCRKSFSEPHVGIGGSLNVWGGRGFPQAYYYGVQPDVGLKVVFPWNGGAFTIGPYLGLAWNRAVSNDKAGRYEGRQTTFPLIIERATLDFYWPKCELNWWAQGTQGLRGYKASTFNGVQLDNVSDPANTLSSIGTGLKIFFGSPLETRDVDMGNGVVIPQVAPKRFRFGLFSEFNTTFEGVLNHRYDEDPAYAIGGGPAFQFPRARIILSQKNLYLWHFKNSRNNGYTAGLQFDWEIAQRFWAPGAGGKK